MSDSLVEAWAKLASSSGRSAGLRRIRIDPLRYRVYAGWTMPAGRPALAVLVATVSVPPDIELPQSTGFSVTVERLPQDNESSILLLEADSERYYEVFARLAEDVQNNIAGAKNEEMLVTMFVARLQRWQGISEMPQRYSPLTLWTDWPVGGTMVFLLSSLVPKIGIDAAVRAWRGPDGANQDFEFDGQAVEVKTSSANPEGKVHISNILQLTDRGLDALYLRHILVSTHQQAGLSLPELILRVRNELSVLPTAGQLFETKLFDAGYLDSEESHYRRMGLA